MMRKRLAQALVIFGIGVLLLMAGLTMYGHRAMRQEMKRQTMGEGTYLLLHPILGLVPRPSSTFTHEQVTKAPADSIVRYTMDAEARRITPHVDTPTDHLMLFGCSYTFGQGLQDTSRIGWHLAERWPNTQVHDHSFMGFGPQQTLDIIETGGQSSREHRKEDVVGVYAFIDHHIQRALGDPFSLRWLYPSSRYALSRGRAVRSGSFVQTAPVKTGLVNGLQAMRLDAAASIVHVVTSLWRHQDYGERLVASMCARMQRSFKRRFPNGRFYVLIFPEEKTEILPYLKDVRVSVIDLRDRACLDACEGRQADGYHPNEKGARAVSGAIIEALEEDVWERVPSASKNGR